MVTGLVYQEGELCIRSCSELNEVVLTQLCCTQSSSCPKQGCNSAIRVSGYQITRMLQMGRGRTNSRLGTTQIWVIFIMFSNQH